MPGDQVSRPKPTAGERVEKPDLIVEDLIYGLVNLWDLAAMA